MKICTHILKSAALEQIETELRFVIASARALGNELIYLKVESEDDSVLDTIILKQLKAIKRQGKIDFFADKNSFSSLNAEASYLTNKFPHITEHIDDSIFFIIKL